MHNAGLKKLPALGILVALAAALICATGLTTATQAYAASKPGKASIAKAYSKSCSGITVSLKKTKGASGYQVRYSTKSSMKGAKTKTATSRTFKLTKLKSGTSYYVQARAYKKSGKSKIYGAWSSKAKRAVTKITISDYSYPAEITLHSAYDFKGTISSNYKIKKVVGYFYNSSNKKVQRCSDTPNKKSYKLYCSKIDNNLTCGKLPAGTYTYKLVAYVNETHKTLISQAFRVKSSGSTNTNTSGGSKLAINYSKYNTTAKTIFNFCKSKGCSNEAAAAIVGNAQQESSLNPACTTGPVYDKNGKLDKKATLARQRSIGYGLFQMTNTRYDALKAYAKSRGKAMSDVTTQMEFLFMELNGYTLNGKRYYSEWFGSNYKINGTKVTVQSWKTWKNVDMATEAFCECYERAGKPLMAKRKAYARQALSLARQGWPLR